jgi:membrane protein involved in colicin uptake
MFSCNVCSSSDPTTDTVKVDMDRYLGKENVQPPRAQNANQEAEKLEKENQLAQRKEAEERRQAEEKQRRAREEEEAKRRQEEQKAAERAAAERAAAERAAAECAAAERAAAEAAAKAMKEEQEEQARVEAEIAAVAAERARREREAAVRAEKQRQQEERLARDKVSAWCKSNGFSDMHAKKKSLMSGSRYPLHEAVAKTDEEMVGLLVQAGADKTLKNSKGQTPEDVATKMNKSGAMDGILAILR